MCIRDRFRFMQNLKWCFICHHESTFQKFPVEVFIHRKKKRFRIPDHPVCHSSPGDLHAILFPVLFLTGFSDSFPLLFTVLFVGKGGRYHAKKTSKRGREHPKTIGWPMRGPVHSRSRSRNRKGHHYKRPSKDASGSQGEVDHIENSG